MAEDDKLKRFIAPLNRGGAFTPVGEFRLEAKQKRELCSDLVLAISATDRRVASFISALEEDIAHFITALVLERERRVAAEISGAILDIKKSVEELRRKLDIANNETLRRLDIGLQALRMSDPEYHSLSTGPWRLAGQPHFTLSVTEKASPETAEFLAHLMRDLSDLDRAITIAKEGAPRNKGGRRAKSARLLLAWGIAKAFTEHLKMRATTTTDGKFEKVLSFSLIAAGDDVNDRDLHALVLKALEGRKPLQKNT